MKMNVIGVKRIKGNAKATGNPFDICSLLGMVQIEQVNTEKMQISGAGFEISEIPLEVDSLPSFLGLKYPVTLDLKTDVRPRFGKFETVVVGFETLAQTVKAA